jgi:alpha-1,2-mannosyltransferase
MEQLRGNRLAPNRPWFVALGFLSLTAAILLHVRTILWWKHDLWWEVDLSVYRAGGQNIIDHAPLYAHGLIGPLQFVYPPFAALLFAPVAPLSMSVLRFAAMAVNVAILIGCVWLALGYLGYRRDMGRLGASLLLSGFAFWLDPVRETVILGQINLVLLILVLVDLRLSDRNRFKGVGVGLAAGIKLVPAIFILYLLITRRTRAAVTAIATFAGTVAVGFAVAPHDSYTFFTSAMFKSNRITAASTNSNQSLAGLVARIDHRAATAPTAPWALLCLITLAGGLYMAWKAHQRGEELLAVVVTGMVGCLVSPVAWSHHWVWFAPLLVLLVHNAATRWRSVWALTIAVYLAAFPWVVGSAPKGRSPAQGLFLRPTTGALRYLTDNMYVWIALVALVASAVYLKVFPAPAASSSTGLSELPAHAGSTAAEAYAVGDGPTEGAGT